MKLLHLTLKKKWFDMIASGDKKEEYREIKPYWINRLMDGVPMKPKFKSFIGVLFRNGYSKDARQLAMFIEDISIGEGREDWGAELGKKYFVIKIKPIINP